MSSPMSVSRMIWVRSAAEAAVLRTRTRSATKDRRSCFVIRSLCLWMDQQSYRCFQNALECSYLSSWSCGDLLGCRADERWWRRIEDFGVVPFDRDLHHIHPDRKG